ncbi:hypothetical protein GGI12_005848, partial [Dipsacomyces acuminosporus]
MTSLCICQLVDVFIHTVDGEGRLLQINTGQSVDISSQIPPIPVDFVYTDVPCYAFSTPDYQGELTP